MSALLRAQQIPCPANLEISHRNGESGPLFPQQIGHRDTAILETHLRVAQPIFPFFSHDFDAADMAKAAIGFGRDKREGEDTAAIERTFTPEFRNRLDAVISFGALPKEVILQVVEKFVLQLEAQLLDRGVHIELTRPAAEKLADMGSDDKMGARPLARVIQEEIKKPLAEELLFGKLAKGGIVKVGVKEGKLDLRIEQKTKRIAKKKPPLLTAD